MAKRAKKRTVKGSGARAVLLDYANLVKDKLWTLFDGCCYVAGVSPPEPGTSHDWFSNIGDEEKRNLVGAIYKYAKNEILSETLRAYPELLKGQIPGRTTRVSPAKFVTSVARRYSIPRELMVLTTPATREELKPKERTTYNHIIGALLQTILGETGATTLPFDSEASLIEHLAEKFAGFQGATERTLQAKFAEAKRALQSSK